MCISIGEALDAGVGGGRAYVIVPSVSACIARRLLSLAATNKALIITNPSFRNPLYVLTTRWARGESRESLALGLVFASGLLSFLVLLLSPNVSVGLLIGVGIGLVFGVLAWRVANEEPPQGREWLVNVRFMDGLDSCLLIIGSTAWFGKDCDHLCPVHPDWARRVFEEYWPIAEPITPPPQLVLPGRG